MKHQTLNNYSCIHLLAISIAAVTRLAPAVSKAGDAVPVSAQAWVRQMHPGGVTRINNPAALKVGPDGTLYLLGHSMDQYFTMGLSREGIPLWTNYYSGPYPEEGPYFDIACDLAVDGGGNAYVTGFSAGEFGSLDRPTVAYAKDGTTLWTNSIEGTMGLLGRLNLSDWWASGPNVVPLCVDSSGRVHASWDRDGWSQNVAYSNTGSPLWNYTFYGSSGWSALDSSGNLVLTTFTDYPTTHNGLLCLSPDGTVLCTNALSTSIGPVAVDRNDRIYVASGEYTVAYSNQGSPIWANQYSYFSSSYSSYTAASGVAIGPMNQLYVTFASRKSDPWPGTNLTSILAYSSDGAPLWTNTFPGQSGVGYDDRVACDSNDNVYVTLRIGPDDNFLYADWATIAYEHTGQPVWTNVLSGPRGEFFSPRPKACMAVSPEGEVYVATQTPDGGVAVVKYVTGFAPTITSQPNSQVVNEGDDVTLQFAVNGTDPLSFLWSLNGSELQETTGPALLLTNVSKSSEGLYSVTISNLFGTAQSSSAFLKVNLRPVANASATPTFLISANNSNVTAVLDASGSYDPDGDPLQYFWFFLPRGASPTLLANAMVTKAVLPLGTNRLNLVVSDGFAAATNSIALAVMTPPQAVEQLLALVNAAGVSHSQPLLASLNAALAAISRGDYRPAANQLAAFQHKTRAQVPDQSLVRQLLISSQQIIDALIGP